MIFEIILFFAILATNFLSIIVSGIVLIILYKQPITFKQYVKQQNEINERGT